LAKKRTVSLVLMSLSTVMALKVTSVARLRIEGWDELSIW